MILTSQTKESYVNICCLCRKRKKKKENKKEKKKKKKKKKIGFILFMIVHK